MGQVRRGAARERLPRQQGAGRERPGAGDVRQRLGRRPRGRAVRDQAQRRPLRGADARPTWCRCRWRRGRCWTGACAPPPTRRPTSSSTAPSPAAAIVHTHSEAATAFAQARLPIRCMGTTHADHFRGDVPVTRPLTRHEVEGEYERNTGLVIVETLPGAATSLPRRSRRCSWPSTARSPGERRVRGGRARPDPRVLGAHGGEGAPARPRRSPPRSLPGRPALPAQARPGRLLRPAAKPGHSRGRVMFEDQVAFVNSQG